MRLPGTAQAALKRRFAPSFKVEMRLLLCLSSLLLVLSVRTAPAPAPAERKHIFQLHLRHWLVRPKIVLRLQLSFEFFAVFQHLQSRSSVPTLLWSQSTIPILIRASAARAGRFKLALWLTSTTSLVRSTCLQRMQVPLTDKPALPFWRGPSYLPRRACLRSCVDI